MGNGKVKARSLESEMLAEKMGRKINTMSLTWSLKERSDVLKCPLVKTFSAFEEHFEELRFVESRRTISIDKGVRGVFNSECKGVKDEG